MDMQTGEIHEKITELEAKEKKLQPLTPDEHKAVKDLPANERPKAYYIYQCKELKGQLKDARRTASRIKNDNQELRTKFNQKEKEYIKVHNDLVAVKRTIEIIQDTSMEIITTPTEEVQDGMLS